VVKGTADEGNNSKNREASDPQDRITRRSRRTVSTEASLPSGLVSKMATYVHQVIS
jgi:hypothetical protein